jgi:hypothetical protein
MTARSNSFRSTKKSTINAKAATDAMIERGRAEFDWRSELTLKLGREFFL